MKKRHPDGVIGAFRHVDAACDAIREIKKQGHKDFIVYTPVPNVEIANAIGHKVSPVRRWTLAGGLLGVTTGFLMTIWMSYDYPIVVGGKPLGAPVPYVVIAFELTILFGAFLLYSAVRMLLLRHENVEPGDNPLVRLARRWLPLTNEYHGHHFIVKVDGKMMATPLLLALLLVESSDVMFAVDSIPAVFAVTRDPFIIFTSNIFAILGLRSLYFVLATYMEKCRYLKHSLVFVLAYVGVKMIISNHWHIPDAASMAIIVGILLVGIMASIHGAKKDPVPLRSPLD